MGTVFKKTYTKPVPVDAEIVEKKGQRLARWRNRKGKLQSAPVTVGQDGSARVLVESNKYIAKYRDAAGFVQEVPTGCKDETAARQFLAGLEREAELIKAGSMTTEQAAVGKHSSTGIRDHFSAFEQHLLAKGTTKIHRENTLRYLLALAKDCKFSTLADLQREKLERWLAGETETKRSARSRNAYRDALVTFCNWCISTHRLTGNPFKGIHKANEKANPKRQRRAMTESELNRLLFVASRRPLAEFGRLSVTKKKEDVKRKRDTWTAEPLTADDLEAATERARERLSENPSFIAELELRGRERTLTYKTLVLTGLRRNELRTLTVSQLYLAESPAFLSLDAADEKNREGSHIPLRDDLADDLRQWLDDKLERLREECRATGEPIPVRLPPDTPVFQIPAALVKILDRDLKAAGIPKRDERGRTLDVHALRTTFGTLLSKGGVSPRTAQAAMRHSKLELTMQVYTDPKLLDVAGAMSALPTLRLDGSHPQADRMTGTDARTLAPMLAPDLARTGYNQGQPQSIIDQTNIPDHPNTIAISAYPDKRKDSLTIAVNESFESGREDSNLRPLEPHSSALAKLRHAPMK
jgi:integrase